MLYSLLRPAAGRPRPPPASVSEWFACMYDLLPAKQNPVLPTGTPATLRPYMHSNIQKGVLALPGQDIQFLHGGIDAGQIKLHRPSYTNAILIRLRGSRPPEPCVRCRTGQEGPCPKYRHLPGAFGGACANCK
ncbi:hypothetical protein BP00DRAFT_21 [Aspergillus indologenus CBS 114.80]|uniref:Uncharacterized protein n=1 Tax=Aspergillus indologenus CBS 114.80 TaxID=1450541 RepID=A0A2V5JID2_9EURO|nr:hypothetical protein BP00DRAFT_21 [Aspergillus indologenus CBS 114.80]